MMNKKNKLITSASFIFSFLLVLPMVHAQSKIAISQNARWVTFFQLYDGQAYSEWYVLYKSAGDTIIKGINYTKLTRTPVGRTGATTYDINGQANYIAAYRNDSSNRAFIFPENDSIERLWYDFNLSIGDTISKVYSLLESNSPAIITSIDSIQYCGVKYQQFVINNNSSGGPGFPRMVKGIGFTGDLLNSNLNYFEGFVTLMEFSDSAQSGCFTITDVPKVKEEDEFISIYPNPCMGSFTIRSKNTLPENVIIRDLAGREVWKLGLKKGVVTQEIHTNLPSGIYIVELSEPAGRALKQLDITQ